MELMVLMAERASAPARLAARGGHADIGDVGGEFDDDGGAGALFDPAR